MTAAVATLNPAARAALAACELQIEHGLKTFFAVGQALAEIRDSRLYRGTHDTFEAYCRERWNITPQHANRLVMAAEVVGSMEPIGSIPPPANEGQARALAAVPEPERSEVWREAVERTGGKPTAKAVAEVARERAEPAPVPTPEPTGPPLSTAPVGSGPASPEPERHLTVVPAPEAGPTPPAGSPATWTPEEQEAHRREVERKQAIAACERTADALVMEISGMVTVIIDGLDFGAPGIPVSLAMIDECRAALDRLEERVMRA